MKPHEATRMCKSLRVISCGFVDGHSQKEKTDERKTQRLSHVSSIRFRNRSRQFRVGLCAAIAAAAGDTVVSRKSCSRGDEGCARGHAQARKNQGAGGRHPEPAR